MRMLVLVIILLGLLATVFVITGRCEIGPFSNSYWWELTYKCYK